jgi:hypothetical protein
MSVLAVCLIGCGGADVKKAGDACTQESAGHCFDSKSQLLCQNGVYVSLSCNGPKGCVQDDQAQTVHCDAAAGDPCLNETSGHCADATNALQCTNGHYRAVPCRGPNGCADDGQQFHCDASQDQVGDACLAASDGKFICTTDGKQELICQSGTWQVSKACASGCSVQSGKVLCK